ncbi:MAG: permease-like cell division protein FtsX [Longicatena sp.]
MKKLYRYFKLHVNSAYKSITRHLGLTFSATFAISITLILISIFMLITSNLTNFTYHVEQQVSIRASIDNVVKAKDKEVMLTQIQQLDGVKKITLSSGDEELQAYKKEVGDDKGLFSMYEGETNPIRDAFIIEVQESKDIDQIAKKIKAMKGIVSAEYGGDSTEDLIKGFETVRSGGLVFAMFLVIVAMFLIANKIKMSIYTRKNEIAIMRYVGASNLSIKLPMMLEGAFIGFVGALLPVCLTIFGYQYVYNAMNGALMTHMFEMKEVFPLTTDISLLLIAVGMCVGLVGSFFSTTRYLRWKR